jgi:hypothetical protein
MIRSTLAAVAALALSAPALAALQTIDEVDACVEANLPAESSIQTVVMDAHDRIGAVTQTRARIYWRRFDDLSKVLVRLSDPPEMRGAAILMLETSGERNDILMYLPELDRVKRVTGHMLSGSVFGTDFSYEEFEGLQGLQNDNFERTLEGTEPVGGRPTYIIESAVRPGFEDRSAYRRTRTWVDQESCLPIKVEFFEANDRLRKRLVTDPSSIETRGDRRLARRLEIEDLRDGTHTVMRVEEVDLEANVKASLFTTRSLERLGGKTF